MTRPRKPTRAELAQIRDFLASDEAVVQACESMGFAPPTRDEYVGVDLAPGVERKRGPKELTPPEEPEEGDVLRWLIDGRWFVYGSRKDVDRMLVEEKFHGIDVDGCGFWSRRLGRVCP